MLVVKGDERSKAFRDRMANLQEFSRNNELPEVGGWEGGWVGGRAEEGREERARVRDRHRHRHLRHPPTHTRFGGRGGGWVGAVVPRYALQQRPWGAYVHDTCTSHMLHGRGTPRHVAG